ncbi:mitochondrial carrier domain-containing protein [Cladochytrium replicatum]|nr:mitochondrial carrier domain-containing protein [Cladochytrium replicatum]
MHNHNQRSSSSASEIASKFALSAASGSVAEFATFPIDTVKTRLQLARDFGPLRMASEMAVKEGIGGFYRGVGAAVLRHVPYTGTRVVIYEQIRQAVVEREGKMDLRWRMLAGLTAGALGQLVAVPTDLVKVRMQADGRRVQKGLEPRYRSALSAFPQIVREEGGVRSLWRGASPAVQRAALVNLGELATYDSAKQYMLRIRGGKDDVLTHILSSMCSGFCGAFLSTPADVIKTRCMNQDPKNPIYKGTLDCLAKTVRAEGTLYLWKGFMTAWFRIGPWQSIYWVSYEQLRVLSGYGGF